MEKPKDFLDFENEYEIERENNDSDLQNRKIFLETRNLFIIKEQETWKIPGKRKKWNNLMKLIKKWKIKWLLSYSPDRQARNMVEWWEIINLVDEWLLNLKYTNFHFENNASWKMMLWIWFVFSKQYSDKLSEDITRWNKNKILSWKAIWKYKPWYFINKEWYHEPHPEFFYLIKKAFEMKLEWIVESRIKEFLDASWFHRKFKNDGRKEYIKKSLLNKMFRDDFYYWKLISWDNFVDLLEVNPYFKPIVSEDEFQILQERYYLNPASLVYRSKTKDEYENLKVFDIDFLLTEDNFWLTFNIPNKKRFSDKIIEEWKNE